MPGVSTVGSAPLQIGELAAAVMLQIITMNTSYLEVQNILDLDRHVHLSLPWVSSDCRLQ